MSSDPVGDRIGRLEAVAVLTAIVFVLALFAAAILAGGRASFDAVKSLPGSVFFALLTMSAFNYAMRVLRWLVFSRALGVNVPAAANALYYVAGFAMTTTPGKLGEALRLWLLRRAHGCRYADTAGLLIADRLWDAVAMAAVLCASVAWLSAYLWIALAAALIVGGATALCLYPDLLLAGIDIGYGFAQRKPRMFAAWRRAVRKLRLLARPDIFGAGLILGVAGWLSEGLSLYVLLHALGSDLHPMRCVFIFSFSMIVGAISILPGGLGSTEATMVGLLSLQGLPLQTAIVATGLVRVTTLWFAVGLGMLALPSALRRARAMPMLAGLAP